MATSRICNPVFDTRIEPRHGSPIRSVARAAITVSRRISPRSTGGRNRPQPVSGEKPAQQPSESLPICGQLLPF
jgi:hypothetical protein